MAVFRDSERPRGLTLIELMVVVVIVGVLAAIGGVAYMNQMRKGKVTKLKQYALEVKKGQEQYASRNAEFLDPTDTEYDPTSSDADEWEQLLEFQHDELANLEISVQTEAGAPGETCGICPVNLGPETANQSWFVVLVRQELKPGGEPTTILAHNQRDDLVERHVGE